MGGEFQSFTNTRQNCGIVHRRSCPHVHEQNGAVERKHRQIVETGLILLAQAGMPLKDWDEAFRTSVFLINRLPTPKLAGKIPVEVLHKIPPDCSSLRVFGCSCFPNIRAYNKHKLQFRSVECTFVGV